MALPNWRGCQVVNERPNIKRGTDVPALENSNLKASDDSIPAVTAGDGTSGAQHVPMAALEAGKAAGVAPGALLALGSYGRCQEL